MHEKNWWKNIFGGIIMRWDPSMIFTVLQPLLQWWENRLSATTVAAATNNKAHWRNIWNAAKIIWRAWTIRPQSTGSRKHRVTQTHRSTASTLFNIPATATECIHQWLGLSAAGEESANMEIISKRVLQPSSERIQFVERLANSITKRKRSTPQKFLGRCS